MNTPKPVKPIGRKALREALNTVPLDSLFSPAVSKELTGKQKRFALEVAKGSSKAEAYRRAYNVKSKNTLQREPYQLTRDQRITNEIEALQLAIKAQEYQTPAALRALVIQSLVGVITNPDAQPGQITAAAKVLGTVTEVAAFTERKEVRTITSSEDARASIMAQLKALSNASATDAHIIDAQADDLMRELAGSETHPPPTPTADDAESLTYTHTIPHEQPLPNSAATPQDSPTQETPPSSSET
jgi:predicted nucleic acid-binding protein